MNELDALIRRILRASVGQARPAPQTRETLLRRAGERQARRLLWLPISSAAWVAETGLAHWSESGWNSQVYLLSPYSFKRITFPTQIL
jgi:hypothetical protein